MKLRILAASAATVLTAVTLVAAPAEAAAFGVTLKTDFPKADVNKTFRLSGKVTGTGAAKKTIIVQRKIGSAAWKNYSTVTTRDTGTYAKAFTMASVGAKSFRVLVPKTSKLTTGTSNTVKVTGFAWLDLADQPAQYSGSGLFNVDGRVNGQKYAKSIVLRGGGDLLFNLDGSCDRVVYGFGLDERDSGAEQPFVGLAFGEGGSQELSVTTADLALKSVDQQIGATTDEALYFARQDTQTPSAYVAITTPRVHCSITRLPTADFDL